MIELRVPPLRERREEIPALVEFFLVKYAKRLSPPAARPSQVLIEALLEYAWPGNIRELENMMKRFVVLQDEALVLSELATPRKWPTSSAPPPPARPRRPSRLMGVGSQPAVSELPAEPVAGRDVRWTRR